MVVPVYGRNDVARGVQDYYNKKPGLDLQRQELEARSQAAASKRQADIDAKAFDEALFRDAQMQGGGIRGVSATQPPQQPAGQPPVGPTPTPQPSMTDRRIGGFKGIRGGGAQAQKIRSANIAGAQKHEQQIFDLLKSGSPTEISQAKYIAKRNNIDMPDSFFDDPYVRATLVDAIDRGQKVTKNPRELNSFIQAYLGKNTEFLDRVSQGQQAGRGMPEAMAATAKTSRTMGAEKFKQDTLLAKQRQRNAQAINRYPEERVRLELTKMFSDQENRRGEPMYTPEQVGVLVDQEIMRKAGDAPAKTAPPMSTRDWAEKEFGPK